MNSTVLFKTLSVASFDVQILIGCVFERIDASIVEIVSSTHNLFFFLLIGSEKSTNNKCGIILSSKMWFNNINTLFEIPSLKIRWSPNGLKIDSHLRGEWISAM